jgi:hypothetical protein
VSAPVAAVAFALSLVATLGSATLFAERLDRLGARLGLTEALSRRGHEPLVTALGGGLAQHRPAGPQRLSRELALMALAVAAIVAGSIVMVDAALVLADRSGVGHATTGCSSSRSSRRR